MPGRGLLDTGEAPEGTRVRYTDRPARRYYPHVVGLLGVIQDFRTAANEYTVWINGQTYRLYPDELDMAVCEGVLAARARKEASNA